MHLSSILVLVGVVCAAVEAKFACDDVTEPRRDIEYSTREIVRRLMRMRKQDGAWTSPRTPIVLQLTVPEKFYERQRTERAMIKNIKKDFLNMNLRTKSEYTIAMKAFCLDPHNIKRVNMVDIIAKELMKELDDSDYSAIDHNMFSIGIGALCIADYNFADSFIDKFLSGQHDNGTFGNSNPTEDTILLLPAMQCLVQMADATFNKTKVLEAVDKMREHVITIHSGDEPQHKDESLTSLAMVGLKQSQKQNENSARWRCSHHSNTLGLFPSDNESEAELVSRLMRLHGKAFMDIAKPDYHCVDPDPMPKKDLRGPNCN